MIEFNLVLDKAAWAKLADDVIMIEKTLDIRRVSRKKD
jgi:hypothetical protein